MQSEGVHLNHLWVFFFKNLNKSFVAFLNFIIFFFKIRFYKIYLRITFYSFYQTMKKGRLLFFVNERDDDGRMEK